MAANANASDLVKAGRAPASSGLPLLAAGESSLPGPAASSVLPPDQGWEPPSHRPWSDRHRGASPRLPWPPLPPREDDVRDLSLHERRRHYGLLAAWIQVQVCGGRLRGGEEQMGRVRDLGFQPGSGRSEARGEFLARVR